MPLMRAFSIIFIGRSYMYPPDLINQGYMTLMAHGSIIYAFEPNIKFYVHKNCFKVKRATILVHPKLYFFLLFLRGALYFHCLMFIVISILPLFGVSLSK